MLTPTVSVIVPTFRREEALCKMLQTLLVQNIDDFEILLIDQTPQHCEKTISFLSSNSGRIKRVFQATPNLPMARNNGLSLVSGRYIIFVDDDVLLPPDCIQRLVDHLAEGAADGVSGSIIFELSRDKVGQHYPEGGISQKGQQSKLLFVREFVGAVMAFRREVFSVIGGFDERLGLLSSTAAGEDNEFCRRATRAGFRLAIDPDLVIQHPLGVAGGCAAREASPEIALSRQLQSSFFIEMKLAGDKGHLGSKAWLRMLRGYVINRVTVKEGFLSVYKRARLLRSGYKIARDFYRNHPTCANTPAHAVSIPASQLRG